MSRSPVCRLCKKKMIDFYIDGVDNAKDKTCIECDRDSRMAEWRKTGVITTKTLFDAILDNEFRLAGKNPGLFKLNVQDSLQLASSYRRIMSRVYEFESTVWLPVLRGLIKESDGVISVENNVLNVRIARDLDRVTVSVRDRLNHGSLLLVTSYKNISNGIMGVHHIRATESDAVILMNHTIDHWQPTKFASRINSRSIFQEAQ